MINIKRNGFLRYFPQFLRILRRGFSGTVALKRIPPPWQQAMTWIMRTTMTSVFRALHCKAHWESFGIAFLGLAAARFLET